MSLLTLVQGVARRCNLNPPATAMGNPDPTVQALVDCAQDAGDECVERWQWKNLKTAPPATFTGDGSTTLFLLPASYQYLSPSNTFVSSLYPSLVLPGPMNDEDLLRFKAYPYTPVPSVWRPVSGYIEFFPAPAAGEIISYYYGAGAWITNAGGLPYSVVQWTADSDLTLIPERVIRLGAIRNWKAQKGLDFTKEETDFENCFIRRAAQEGTERVIITTHSPVGVDNWWPGTIVDMTEGP